ncbi:MAG: ABC transporter ATP-binding protein [Theionarchaea archaeon]|nr:ABC transporter ATP-binding protein [Theionarchaea archaeon]
MEHCIPGRGENVGNIIQTIHLAKKFGTVTALDRLDLAVSTGEIYGLLGPNGAGKTTVIRILSSLLVPTSGEAYVLEKKVPDKSIASSIGYMPQETALDLGLKVHELLQFYGEIFGLPKSTITEKESELLKFVDLEAWRNTLIANLSGGMKHRVSLACALIHDPCLLFLDEPTVGVDPELRFAFWDHFQALKETGVTILITTHYMDEAKRCDRIGFIRRGKIIAEGSPSDLLERAKTESLEDAFVEFSKQKVTP